MKILLVTEKCNPSPIQRDGGARVVDTLKESFGQKLSIMQFGLSLESEAEWCYDYPFYSQDRFERRIANANFIINQVKQVESHFSHIFFIHISMQFGIVHCPLKEDVIVWTFPMFLTPSYRASGETVPEKYFELEQLALKHSHQVLTPSHLERRQLINLYNVPPDCVHVIPRGINTSLLKPVKRVLDGPPKFCSVGSIKPQKNTIKLVHLFNHIQKRHPDSSLKIIGPIQDSGYYDQLQQEIQNLGLQNHIEVSGHIQPDKLSDALRGYHIHLSCSKCETFGRSIFETLALGLPNVASKKNNAAAEFLDGLPYAHFTDNILEALGIVEHMLRNLSDLSSLSLEVGTFYDDAFLSQMLTAKIMSKDVLAISDFDGTLFHKDNPEKTKKSIHAFQEFPIKVVCSARPLKSILKQLELYNLKVDWIISYSGGVISNGSGRVIHISKISNIEIAELKILMPQAETIEYKGHRLQMKCSAQRLPNLPNYRAEIYQDTAYIMKRQVSKFRAIYWLLQKIKWQGQVQAFGDSIYDAEFLTYFGSGLSTTGYQQEGTPIV